VRVGKLKAAHLQRQQLQMLLGCRPAAGTRKAVQLQCCSFRVCASCMTARM
jgi:hypothetical protein